MRLRQTSVIPHFPQCITLSLFLISKSTMGLLLFFGGEWTCCVQELQIKCLTTQPEFPSMRLNLIQNSSESSPGGKQCNRKSPWSCFLPEDACFVCLFSQNLTSSTLPLPACISTRQHIEEMSGSRLTSRLLPHYC